MDEDDREVQEARDASGRIDAAGAKRKAKAAEKMKGRAATTSRHDGSSKVGKLSLKKGALGLFAVCEISAKGLIVNHTRNTKGYISLDGTEFTKDQFKLGQLVVASVKVEIGGVQGAVF